MRQLQNATNKLNHSNDNSLAIIGSKNSKELNRDKLIGSYIPFVAKTVSSVCRKYITESDDEFSIGLIAFNDAIDKYSIEKGTSFLNFAKLLIKRRVIDYIRSQTKHIKTYQVYELTHLYIVENERAIEAYERQENMNKLKEEIIRFEEELQQFDISIKELFENCPKHVDAKQNAFEIGILIAKDEELLNSLMDKKQLPIKSFENRVKTGRKTIERNRKYIISIVVILIGDFIFLKNYVKGNQNYYNGYEERG